MGAFAGQWFRTGTPMPQIRAQQHPLLRGVWDKQVGYLSSTFLRMADGDGDDEGFVYFDDIDEDVILFSF